MTRASDGFAYEADATLGYLVYSDEPPHELLLAGLGAGCLAVARDLRHRAR